MPHAYTTASVAGRIKSLIELNPNIEPKDVADQIECTTEYANHVMCRLKVRSRVHCGDFRKSAIDIFTTVPEKCDKCGGPVVKNGIPDEDGIVRGHFCFMCGKTFY